MKTIFNILFIFFITMSVTAQAKVLLVSDIDDTVKISHVLDTTDSISYAFDTENAFLGMNMLYQFFAAKWGHEIDFLYLSNAPSWLMQSWHEDFLITHAYPSGEVRLVRTGEDKKVHKLKQMRNWLRTGSYDLVLLVGDNGENDVDFYKAIQSEIPKIRFVTYIHQLYSVLGEDDDTQGRELYNDQVGFVSPVEILLDLNAKGLLQQSEMMPMASILAGDVMRSSLDEDEGVLTFPLWLDCRDFQWRWQTAASLVAYQSFVQNRCSQNPEENDLWRLSKKSKHK